MLRACVLFLRLGRWQQHLHFNETLLSLQLDSNYTGKDRVREPGSERDTPSRGTLWGVA